MSERYCYYIVFLYITVIIHAQYTLVYFALRRYSVNDEKSCKNHM